MFRRALGSTMWYILAQVALVQESSAAKRLPAQVRRLPKYPARMAKLPATNYDKGKGGLAAARRRAHHVLRIQGNLDPAIDPFAGSHYEGPA